mgnify:FL=1
MDRQTDREREKLNDISRFRETETQEERAIMYKFTSLFLLSAHIIM